MTGIRAREPDFARPVGPRTGSDASAAPGTARCRGFVVYASVTTEAGIP